MVLHTNSLNNISRKQSRNVTFMMEETSRIEGAEIIENIRITSFCPSMATESFPSKKTVLLLRGSSFSLVDLPTFLPSSCTVQTRCPCYCTLDRNGEKPTIESGMTLEEVLANYQPRNQTMRGPRSQWTVMIVAISFFTTCLLMVGVMLSFTSEYQDIAIARVLNSRNGSTIRYFY